MENEETEEVTDIHVSRWGDWRGFAAVRRSRGGAIVLNVDASAVESLRRQASLDALLADVVESASEVAYVIFEQGGLRITHGDIQEESADEVPNVELVEGSNEDLHQRELDINDEPVLEFSGPILLDESTGASLSIGMRLNGLRQAERRMLWQLALSLGASLALAGLGVGTVWLQRKYSLLSERHQRAQEALHRRDRLAAMGELSSTVAHEIRNPLNAIAMSAKRLRREFLDSAKVQDEDRTDVDELLGVLEAETQRINQRVQQFLDYARPPHLAPQRTDLGELVRGVAEGSRAMAANREVRLEVDTSDAGQVFIDPGQIRQALDNIVRNAIEATPDGGHVHLKARRHSAGYEIDVVDSGHGIESEDLPRLFDLYFTTKPDGTGVGLAVTQQIITAHGGTIEVESRAGHGTRMTVKLPRAIEEPIYG
jgi:signal transduction histidine kinase